MTDGSADEPDRPGDAALLVESVALKWLSRRLVEGPYLILVLSEKDYHKVMQKFGVPTHSRAAWIASETSDATTHILRHPKHGLGCVVAMRVRDGLDGIQIAALLVHEAVHVFQEWCDHYGERKPSSEFEAYSIQAISQELMNSYAAQAAGATQ